MMVISPYDLLQEQQISRPHAPWRIMVACSLLNRTHGRQVRPMIDRLFGICPGPNEFVRRWLDDEGEKEITRLLKPLGLSLRRGATLWRMSEAYAQLEDAGGPDFWKTYERADWAVRMPGVGQYALDSLNIFLYGLTENTTSDTWLNKYLDWKRENG